jgi:hypothetical protein
MRNNKFFIQQYSFIDFFHGGIGCVDAEKIMMRKNFHPVLFPDFTSFSIAAKFRRGFYLLKMFFTIGKGAYVGFVFPVYARMNSLLLWLLSFKKGVRIICFVVDIDGIKDNDNELLKKEIAAFNRFKYFVVPNDGTRDWLQMQVPSAIISTVEFLDFLATPFEGNRKKTNQVVFAGNLEKSTFLKKLRPLMEVSHDLHFNLYGPGYTDDMGSTPNVSYKGVANPYELPSKLEGSFGLVWDGGSIDKPEGSLGDYMRYISHHKISLYILSGLPVIVPEIAGSAPLVKKYGIGLTIKNLYEIEDKINSVSEEQYQQMRQNMKPLAKKIANGERFGDALDELMKKE